MAGNLSLFFGIVNIVPSAVHVGLVATDLVSLELGLSLVTRELSKQ